MDLLRTFLPFSIAVMVLGSTFTATYMAAKLMPDPGEPFFIGIATFVVVGCLVSPMAVLHGIYEELKSINVKMGQD